MMLLSRSADQQLPDSSEVHSPKKMTFTNPDYAGDRVVPEDSAVQQIIEQEFKYKRELWRLQKILRRAMSSEDPLPMFNRRHFLILVKRLCKDINRSSSIIDSCTDISTLSESLQRAMPASHSLLCVAYADTLHEIREFLKREMSRKGDSSICFCTEVHAERSLLPLHRLKYLKSLTCLSLEQKNIICSALDVCYTAISSQHSHSYLAEIENLLEFALNMDPPPNPYYSAVKAEPLYQELSPELRRFESKEDHVYEEIAAVLPKLKKKSFFGKKCIKGNKDVSAREEFIPLTRIEHKIREMYA